MVGGKALSVTLGLNFPEIRFSLKVALTTKENVFNSVIKGKQQSYIVLENHARKSTE